jgi:hypothetical protein
MIKLLMTMIQAQVLWCLAVPSTFRSSHMPNTSMALTMYTRMHMPSIARVGAWLKSLERP